MTGNSRGSGRIIGSLRAADGKGVGRMEDRFDTDIDDLWSALTDPSRLTRWLGEVEGELRLGTVPAERQREQDHREGQEGDPQQSAEVPGRSHCARLGAGALAFPP